jgi:hypothetical protein
LCQFKRTPDEVKRLPVAVFCVHVFFPDFHDKLIEILFVFARASSFAKAIAFAGSSAGRPEDGLRDPTAGFHNDKGFPVAYA